MNARKRLVTKKSSRSKPPVPDVRVGDLRAWRFSLGGSTLYTVVDIYAVEQLLMCDIMCLENGELSTATWRASTAAVDELISRCGDE